MLIGVLLGLAWLILLVRYPGRAAPISLGALLGLVLIGAWVLWQEHRLAERLARLEIRLDYDPEQCPADRPLQVHLVNHNEVALRSLHWKVAAYAPGDDLDLAQRTYDAPRYQGPGDLQPGREWRHCIPVPTLRPGYRPRTLLFRAEALEGEFVD